jgi:hypothetical protein
MLYPGRERKQRAIANSARQLRQNRPCGVRGPSSLAAAKDFADDSDPAVGRFLNREVCKDRSEIKLTAQLCTRRQFKRVKCAAVNPGSKAKQPSSRWPPQSGRSHRQMIVKVSANLIMRITNAFLRNGTRRQQQANRLDRPRCNNDLLRFDATYAARACTYDHCFNAITRGRQKQLDDPRLKSDADPAPLAKSFANRAAKVAMRKRSKLREQRVRASEFGNQIWFRLAQLSEEALRFVRKIIHAEKALRLQRIR